MAAPVLLRVSVPRWERVARSAVCAAGITQNTACFGVLLSVLNLSRALEKREPLNKGNGKDKSHSIGVQLKRSPAADPFPCSQCSTDLAWDFHRFYYLTCRQ